MSGSLTPFPYTYWSPSRSTSLLRVAGHTDGPCGHRAPVQSAWGGVWVYLEVPQAYLLLQYPARLGFTLAS